MRNIYKYLPVAVCGAMLLSSCDDDKMDWHSPIPDGGQPVSIEELPISNIEELAQYKNIKEYMKQYMPGVPVGIGLTADMYLNNEDGYSKVCDDNFQQYVTGNAMKMGVMLNNKGEFNFATVDAYIAKAKESNPDVEFYGHNLIWHTQQRQDWLKSLINPKQVITNTGSGESVCENIVSASDFDTEADMNKWLTGMANKNADFSIVDDVDRGKVLKIDATEKGGGVSDWQNRLAYNLGSELEVGKTYAFQYWAKAESSCNVRPILSPASGDYSGQSALTQVSLTSDWNLYTGEITVEKESQSYLFFQFGAYSTTIYLDAFEFGPKKAAEFGGYVTDGSFETQTAFGDEANWSKNAGGGQGAVEIVSLDGAIDGGKVLKVEANESSVQAWDSQISYKNLPAIKGKKMELSFWIKSDKEGKARCSYSGLTNGYPYMNWTGSQSSWTEAFETSTEWQKIDVIIQNFNTDFAEGADTWGINFDLGYVPGVTYYIDAVEVKEVEEAPVSKRALSKKTVISYELKSAEEKAEIIDGAMKQWITGMISHYKNDVKVWEVVNECIADGSNAIRGVDGKGFMADDGVPEESEAEGLNLNWESGSGNQHFYWGYFLGKDFAVKAFQYARQAAGNDAKLYINEYNLEVSDGKLEALIDYVKYIDQKNGGAIVDGIGSQMHIQCFSTSSEESREKAKAGIDNMFTKLAATGKLVRISELDVAIGGESTSALLQAQADTYQYVIESYIKNVPEAQRGGICFWTLSDSEKEHEYWLNGDQPNLFDKNYARKPAYKGVCNGIAGEDLSLGFDHTQW